MSDIRAKILWWAAKRRVKRDRPFIIAITGSIAKTSTKMAVGAVLEQAYPNQVQVGFGNLNSFLGVPLAILGFEVDFYQQKITWQWGWLLKLAIWRGFFGKLPKYLVLEYGADRPGDIERIAGMLPLNVAVITLTGPAHLANYSSIEALGTEKAKILSNLTKDALALVNSNDPFLAKYRAYNTNLIEIQTTPEEISLNFAREIGRRLGVTAANIDAALKNLAGAPGRFQLKNLGIYQLLDDSYNANPLSMASALAKLKKMPGRRVAILGTMKELGPKELELHRATGQLAHQSADVVIGVGELSEAYQPIKKFADSAEAARRVFPYLQKGDSILVKGSHSVQMEKIVNSIEQYVSA